MSNFYITGGNYEFTCEVERNFYNIYKNAEGRKIVGEGWTSKLYLIIWKKLHLPCCLAFRRVKYRAEDIHTSGGYCRQKNCSIKVSSTLSHHSNKLTVTIEGYQPNIFHEIIKRRNLPGDKQELLEKLKGKSAYAVQSELAKELLIEEHGSSAQVPTLNAMRVIKCKSHCPNEKQNAVNALYELRNVHLNSIQRIELYPFATHYSTPSQKSWYRNEFRKNRSTISIDASGVGIESPTDYKKYTLLYVGTAHGES